VSERWILSAFGIISMVSCHMASVMPVRKRLFLLAQFLLRRAEKVFVALITLRNSAVVEAGNETS
jgi:hypothetical protein